MENKDNSFNLINHADNAKEQLGQSTLGIVYTKVLKNTVVLVNFW